MTSAPVLDAGDEVADGLVTTSPGRAAVPRLAVVEDVPEAVPLGGALQRHRDHVVGAADAVRESLVAGDGVDAGVEHGVHRVGAPPPALLRAVHVEALRQRERRAAAHERGAFARWASVEEVHGAAHVVRAPASPVGAAFHRCPDRAFRVGPVEVDDAHARSANVSAIQSAMYALTCGRWSRPMCSAPPSSGVKTRSSRLGLLTACS